MRRTIFTFIMLCFVTLTLQAQDVWTAAGSSTIFGSNWNETDTSNDLTDKGTASGNSQKPVAFLSRM